MIKRTGASTGRTHARTALAIMMSLGTCFWIACSDSGSGAGFLMRVVERHDPAPQEAPETELRTERILMMREYQQTAVRLTEYETLARRFQLKVTEDPDPEDDPVEEEERRTGRP